MTTTVGAVKGLQKVLGALAPKVPETPPVQAPEAPPQSQAAQMPDQQLVRKRLQAAMLGAGPLSTMLTGPRGVAPGTLNLGKSTLLGDSTALGA